MNDPVIKIMEKDKIVLEISLSMLVSLLIYEHTLRLPKPLDEYTLYMNDTKLEIEDIEDKILQI